jgi:hypothetical protein
MVDERHTRRHAGLAWLIGHPWTWLAALAGLAGAIASRAHPPLLLAVVGLSACLLVWGVFHPVTDPETGELLLRVRRRNRQAAEASMLTALGLADEMRPGAPAPVAVPTTARPTTGTMLAPSQVSAHRFGNLAATPLPQRPSTVPTAVRRRLRGAYLPPEARPYANDR